MGQRVSRFPMPSRFLLTANEKDFSLSLEMTVRESAILAPLLSHTGKALVQGHGSPSFLWKEVPRRGGGWLTQRNERALPLTGSKCMKFSCGEELRSSIDPYVHF